MSGGLLRVAVVGATGAVGRELVDLLQERRFPLQELRPIATDRSVGEAVEWLGHELPVEDEASSLHGLDLAFLCTPPEAALGWIRHALEAQVPCIDLSGAAASRREVPLLAPDLGLEPANVLAPLSTVASPAALTVALCAAPLAQAAGLSRLIATVCESASSAGRHGVDALQHETVALFNQQEPPSGSPFPRGVAFDCLPATSALASGGASFAELRTAEDLRRLLPALPPATVTALRVPTFAGLGVSLVLETEGPLEPAAAADLLAKAPGVVLSESGLGPSTRDAVGEPAVYVGRVRRDPAAERGLLLWAASDPIRLVATSALRVAEARLRAG